MQRLLRRLALLLAIALSLASSTCRVRSGTKSDDPQDDGRREELRIPVPVLGPTHPLLLPVDVGGRYRD